MEKILTFEEWQNEEELMIKAAELGADREAGFDSELFAELEYKRYVERMTKK